ncbi:hypothetical protein VE02_01270 [Pseudogymnoascus sp. 03VT05]|nr:hypothetical protein VE02_01270 [Pseudogymnoascus sp. 03VT05]
MNLITLLLLCLRISFVHAGEAASFLPAGFTSWFWPSSIVAGDWLYLHGGEIHSNNGSVPVLGLNTQTFAIDLTKTWSTSSVDAKTSNQSADFRPSRRPEMFYDSIHEMVYCYGGEYYSPTFGSDGDSILYDANVKPEVWGFTPPANGYVMWSLQFAKSISDSFVLDSSVAQAFTASSSTNHYSLGGMMTFDVNRVGNGVTSQMVMDELITYDYATQKFTNATTNVTQTSPYRFGGEAHYVPQYGERGVLLFFGGKNPSDRGVNSIGYAYLDSIQVYDIHTNKFYIQHALDAPQGRGTFCTVGASNAENSSYEIFMYGGDASSNDASVVASLSKVYILTLPAFHWIEVSTTETSYRSSHKCQKIGQKSIPEHNQRQMLSVGGVAAPGYDWTTYNDTWASSMKIFDLTALTWSDTYNPDATAYVRPDRVDQFYAGADNSGFPSSWTDGALKSIFQNSTAATAPKTKSTPTPGPGSKASVGAIAGGVVGGVVVAALAGFLLFWFCWRKRKTDNVAGADGPGDCHGTGGYENVKQGEEGVELSVGGGMPRRELAGDSAHRGELDANVHPGELEANAHPPNHHMQEPQELPTGER